MDESRTHVETYPGALPCELAFATTVAPGATRSIDDRAANQSILDSVAKSPRKAGRISSRSTSTSKREIGEKEERKMSDNAERNRLDEKQRNGVAWKKWGPYLSERQWGTVGEGYRNNGAAWNYVTH